MRIRSNFHDYYDAAMAFGQDPLLVYDRFPKKEEMLRGLFEMAVGRLDCYGFGVHPMIVGFCGKIYKLAELFATHPESSAWSTTEQRGAQASAAVLRRADRSADCLACCGAGSESRIEGRIVTEFLYQSVVIAGRTHGQIEDRCDYA